MPRRPVRARRGFAHDHDHEYVHDHDHVHVYDHHVYRVSRTPISALRLPRLRG